MFWFSMNRFSETWDFLRSLSGFEFEEHPLIWHKNDNQGILPRPQHGPRRLEFGFFRLARSSKDN